MSPLLGRWSLGLSIALVLIASLRIVTTYEVFSHTSDEPAHVACGMEWLDKGIYTWEPQHPPLARVAVALGSYLSGIRSQGLPHTDVLKMYQEGAKILYSGGHYDRTLTLARLGILPFFWVACLSVYLWGRRYYSPSVGCVAVFLLTFLPPVLAHAGLATTDMALTGFMACAFFTGLVWMERPTPVTGLIFGAVSGLMVLSKFTCLAFFPLAVLFALAGWWVSERPRWDIVWKLAMERAPTFGLAIVTGVFVIWAGFRFSWNRGPFPELFAGIRQVEDHLSSGAHLSYLMGRVSDHGFWNFYLIGLGVKSPLAFLGLVAIGLLLVFRRSDLTRRLWLPLAFSLGTLLPAIGSTVNIGVRHVLPVYVGFSLIAAVAVVQMLEWGRTRRWVWGALAVLALWMTVSSVASHPDYLAYFNELAGDHPEDILVDSDLDWGQDVKRLAERLHQLGATEVAYIGYVWAELEEHHGFPKIRPLDRFHPVEGWNAIGVHLWKKHRTVIWPDQVPPLYRVGKSTLLWYFPPASVPLSQLPQLPDHAGRMNQYAPDSLHDIGRRSVSDTVAVGAADTAQ